MTNETKNRIHAYMAELPHMKEKVFGALLMFVIAAVVVVSATYAWLTLSRSPEISEIATTLAANGALEIALSKPDGARPDEFDVDESVAGSTTLTLSNLQWGNLVNLSDASYGLDKLELRPAKLTSDLLNSPLDIALYGEDGRIAGSSTKTTFAKYDEKGGEFAASDDYGVRAIATYTFKTSNATLLEMQELSDAVSTAKGIVVDKYQTVKGALPGLENMISRVAQDIINANGEVAYDSSDVDNNLAEFLPKIEEFYLALEGAMEAQFDAYLALANLQYYQWCKNNGQDFTALSSWDSVEAEYEAGSNWLSITGLGTFMEDYDDLVTDLSYVQDYIKAAENGAQYYWEPSNVASNPDKNDASVEGHTLQDMVSRLIGFKDMTIKVGDSTLVLVKIMNYGKSKLLEMYTNGSGTEYNMYIPGSILQRFEQYALDSGSRLNGKTKCTVTVNGKYIITLRNFEVVCLAQTTAAGESWFNEDYKASNKNNISAENKMAEDIYGMAIDLWVRTNAEKTCLMLEGAITTDEPGNYLSYDGVNRIWGYTSDDPELYPKVSNTTQGGGSCYVYYADTPDDMARSLDLLTAMKVAFVSSEGELLATAEMDTANYLAVNGRITVPLVLSNDATATYATEDGQTGYAITTLYANNAQLVTAIIYLDGEDLTNDDVLATALIQGSLNIQFGSSEKLDTMGDSDLLYATRTVTAEVDDNEFTWGEDDDLTTNVTVRIDGEGSDPTKVTAFFVRAINATQGSREEPMEFTRQDNGTWTASWTFSAPGTYYLRQVRLDGVDYTLEMPPKVVVDGFSYSAVTWSAVTGSENSVTVRTSDSTYPYSVSVVFNTTDINKMPKTVQMSFYRESTKTYITVPLTHSAGAEWKGSGTFNISDTYQLRYIVMDGDSVDLAPDGSYRTLELVMGMYVAVYQNGGTLTDTYTGSDKIYDRDVTVEIFDNSGNELEGLDTENLCLHYSPGGGAIIHAKLTWNATAGRYTGTLPINKVGKYQFAGVEMDGQTLSKATQWPLYTIMNPNPPEYVTSKSTYAGKAQYVLDNNTDARIHAVINNITIENSESASASAVVFSKVYGGYLKATTMAWDESSGSWTVALPAYPTSEGTSTLGDWELVAIYLWDCYYGGDTPRGEDNPILWVDSTSGDQYLESLTDEEGNSLAVTADAYCDFSGLTATVKTYPKLTVSSNDDYANVTVSALGTEFTNEAVYCRPGDDVTVVLKAKPAYYDPRLSKIDGVMFDDSLTGEYKDNATYTFTMPEYDLNIGKYIKATPAATVTIEKGTDVYTTVIYEDYDGAKYELYSTGPYPVQPDTTVTVKLTAAGNYYSPTASVTSGGVMLRVIEQSAPYYEDCYESITYTFTMGTDNVTLTANATAQPKISYTLNNASLTLTINGNENTYSSSGSVSVKPGTRVGWSRSYSEDDNQSTKIDGVATSSEEGSFEMTTSDKTFEISSSGSCVSEETLITLADGSQVRVDSLTGNEQLLVWNHLTGQFDTAPIAYLIDHDGERSEQEVIHLYFSDSSDLEIINEHVFYDADKGKYITLDENAVDYIGNSFAKQNLETGTMDVVTLTDVVFETKVTGVYEVVTYSCMTCFTDGILTASAYIENLLNIFDIDTTTMAYDPVKMQQDIETYGLYTYEDLSHIVNEEQFYMHNGPVTKVAVGKGTITHEEMMALVKLFEAYAKTPGAE